MAFKKLLPMFLQAIVSQTVNKNPIAASLYDIVSDVLKSEMGEDGKDKFVNQLINNLASKFGQKDHKGLVEMLMKMLKDPSQLHSSNGLRFLDEVLRAIEAYKGSILIQPKQIAHALKVGTKE